jgi:hypothetical protein
MAANMAAKNGQKSHIYGQKSLISAKQYDKGIKRNRKIYVFDHYKVSSDILACYHA